MKNVSTKMMKTIVGGMGGTCNPWDITFGLGNGNCIDARYFGRLTDYNGYAGHKHDH